jgi:hypothetical protein
MMSESKPRDLRPVLGFRRKANPLGADTMIVGVASAGLLDLRPAALA